MAARRPISSGAACDAHEVVLEPLVGVAGGSERTGQQIERRRADTRRLSAGEAGGEVADRALGQHAALADHDDLLDCLSNLCEHVAREQHRAAGGCEVPQRVTQPADAVGVEPVGRLVEDKDLGLAEQRTSQAEALAHALGEAADAALGRVREADLVEHLEDARSRNAHRAGQNREMTDRRASGMPDMSVEQGADEAAGLR